MEGNVTELERRYQTLLKDYQSGRVDENTFIAEVDKLQFRDDWGRYWMLGAQTGEWHYYDGQAWHQADPREADKLPFLDSEGRYWQKGIKSGDWYYYEASTGEWVKPDNGGTPAAFAPAAQQTSQWQGSQQAYAPSAAMGSMGLAADMGQGDSQLYQDDDGRYWAMGSKSNQWYFYDQDGWHPSDEFQARTGSPSPQSQFYAPQYQTQGAYSVQDSRPTQVYTTPPAQNYVPQPQQPMYPQTMGYAQPAPPPASAPSGDWYYHDGKQWLKYSSGEPAEGVVPDLGDIPDQTMQETAEAPEPRRSKKSEPVIAEFFDDDDTDIEVVDVEVIPVYDPEPEEVEPEPEPLPIPQPKAEPAPEPNTFESARTEPVRIDTEARTHVPRRSDEIRPRRTRTSPLDQDEARTSREADDRPARKQTASRPTAPIRRTPADPSRPVMPRKRSGAHDPTIIIPTGSTPAPSKPTQTVKPTPSQSDQRRARDNTAPMEPVKPSAPIPVAREKTEAPAVPSGGRHRQVTQELPKITVPPKAEPVSTNTPKTQTQPLPVTPAVAPSKPLPQPKAIAAPAAAPVTEPQEEKEGYTLGDILRSFPSTVWTVIAGIAVLIIAAVLITAGLVYGGNFFGFDTTAAVANPTPTLDSGLALDSTPTPGPTAEDTGVVNTPTAVTYASYSNPDLEIRLEHPDSWLNNEETNEVVLAANADGLQAGSVDAANMRIGKSTTEDIAISDLLTEVLAEFPDNAETLNEGTISIASQTWTSTQIRFDDEDGEGQGIATIAVTTRDGVGYYLVAVAPAQEWNTAQPLFQGVINSFEFVSREEL
ncbi:MAG: hypothetical protein KDJ52_09370, partial [Anaerolineae bacterium]|nr:hypothetical protein [Anaerolineae bacterium]